MRSVVIVVVVVAAGCYHAAVPELRGPMTTLGCVDVVVARGADPAAVGPVVDFAFANHCPRVAPIDLAAVKVRARDEHGLEVALQAYDPAKEIRWLPLGPHERGRESIEYQPAVAGVDPSSICVDVGRLDGSTGVRWVCLDASW